MTGHARGNELNVERAHFGTEVKRRAPWMILAVAAGIVMIWIGESYEAQLSERIQLVFFVPMIVYMSDVIGTETLTLMVRAIAIDDARLRPIFLKEFAVGLCLGLAGGIPMALFSYFWFGDPQLSLTVLLAMIANGAVAVLVGILIPFAFSMLGRDPALGTDEIATALSDILSVSIYFTVAMLVLFGT